MSYSRTEEDGKDTLIFVTAEDHERSSSTTTNSDNQTMEGAITAEGDINWDCPCLGNMASGPCGERFKDAFSCFVYSTAEPKGIDCAERFQTMQECFKQHRDIYGDDVVNDDEIAEQELSTANDPSSERVSETPMTV